MGLGYSAGSRGTITLTPALSASGRGGKSLLPLAGEGGAKRRMRGG